MKRFIRLTKELGWEMTQTVENAPLEFFYFYDNEGGSYHFSILENDTKKEILQILKIAIFNATTEEERKKFEEIYNLSSRLLK